MITLEQAKEALGSTGKLMTDIQIQQTVSLFQNLSESWLDGFERSVFEGRTIRQLLTPDRGVGLL